MFSKCYGTMVDSESFGRKLLSWWQDALKTSNEVWCRMPKLLETFISSLASKVLKTKTKNAAQIFGNKAKRQMSNGGNKKTN